MSNNFMDQIRKVNSPSYIEQQRQEEIKRRGDYIIYGCIQAVQESVSADYRIGHVAGYVGRDVGYDCREHHLISENDRSKENKKTNSDLYHIEDDLEILEYLKSELPRSIRKLGIEQVSIRFEKVDTYRRNNRDLLSWSKYVKTNSVYVIYLDLRWRV